MTRFNYIVYYTINLYCMTKMERKYDITVEN